jgi:transcriptional regulator with PAS, ATPase and Fis domain
MIEAGIYSKSAAQTALETREASTVMLEMTAGANKGKIILATGKPIFNKSGEIKAVVTNVRDITELEDLKAQLQHSKILTEKYSKEIHEIRRQHQKFSDMVVKSAEMVKVMDLASRVAEVDTTVLVTGESGVGKEVIVAYIHKQSPRYKGPMIKINCGAIPGNLLESELFGYESGAFTGARKTGKMGLFELAHEGTILLDEIGEIPLDLQVKLLRVIQNKEITRVGGTKSAKVDVRIVAATNRNLKKMTEEGRFREDLYYRLNVINIHIPPLRDRNEDIPALIVHMLQKFNEQHHRAIRISSQALSILMDYCWPGNIRQLENLMEQLVILTDGNEILPCHLPEMYLKQSAVDKKIYVQGIVPLKEAVEIVEEQIIMNAKNKYCSTRKMAEVLGVNQSTIVRKLKDMALKKDA